jgi:carbonic anhydrase/acetyltransferase-like protein (isoleucine patch superfamily)
MALILPVNGIAPLLNEGCWLAPNATVVGDVVLGKNCSVWFNAVIRGDVNSIRIGDECNIQDGAIIHCTYQKTQTVLGNRVSVAHNAIVHGCTIEDDVLIGMGAIVMDGAIVQSRCIVAAGAVVTQNMVLESGFIYAGSPAKKLKPITEEQGEVFQRTAANYMLYKTWFPNQE